MSPTAVALASGSMSPTFGRHGRILGSATRTGDLVTEGLREGCGASIGALVTGSDVFGRCGAGVHAAAPNTRPTPSTISSRRPNSPSATTFPVSALHG